MTGETGQCLNSRHKTERKACHRYLVYRRNQLQDKELPNEQQKNLDCETNSSELVHAGLSGVPRKEATQRIDMVHIFRLRTCFPALLIGRELGELSDSESGAVGLLFESVLDAVPSGSDGTSARRSRVLAR